MNRQRPAEAGMIVLIVEDDAMIGMLLFDLLQEMGHTACAIVGTEDEAVAEAMRHQSALMLVDVHLAEGCGVSAVRRILRSGPRPFVFMTGLPDLVGWPDATILRKPFTERELAWALRTAVHPGVPPLKPPNSPYFPRFPA